jgi:hypothetical protein
VGERVTDTQRHRYRDRERERKRERKAERGKSCFSHVKSSYDGSSRVAVLSSNTLFYSSKYFHWVFFF